MHIATNLVHLPPHISARGCVVTIGNFDGVHIGHQALLRRTIERAGAAGRPAVAVTFAPHPLRVIMGDAAPPTLMALPRKLSCFQNLGMDCTLVLPFTLETAALAPEEFVRAIFVDALRAGRLIIGYDYAFGKGRRGDAALLTRLGEQHGFAVEQLGPVLLDGDIVSSTRIRRVLLDGDPAAAARLLGRPHAVEGAVVHGMSRGGSLLGFPTANLQPSEDFLLPKPGVYAVLAELQGCPHFLKGVANVGRNPTFGDENLHVETHLLDLHRDIYSQSLNIHFIRHLRDECKFPSVSELVAQIGRDAEAARNLLERLSERGAAAVGNGAPDGRLL